MTTLTGQDIIEVREPTQETDNDFEQEIVFAYNDLCLRVTVYANLTYGPAIFSHMIENDETGDKIFDSWVGGQPSTLPVRINAVVVQRLARNLYKSVKP